jgi:hypothetical protein
MTAIGINLFFLGLVIPRPVGHQTHLAQHTLESDKLSILGNGVELNLKFIIYLPKKATSVLILIPSFSQGY